MATARPLREGGDLATMRTMQTKLDIEQCEPGTHDLEALAEAVRAEYFPSTKFLRIDWGRKIERAKRQSIRLGSYDPRAESIRVHPLLDSPRVPAWFIQSIIHHEYLHHVLGPRHNRRFHLHESRFRYHRESRLWLKRFLPMLLGYRPLPARSIDPRPRISPAPPSESGQYRLFGD